MKSAARVTVCAMERSRRLQDSEHWAKLRYLSDILSSTRVDMLPRLLLAQRSRAPLGDPIELPSATNVIAQCWQFATVE